MKNKFIGGLFAGIIIGAAIACVATLGISGKLFNNSESVIDKKFAQKVEEIKAEIDNRYLEAGDVTIEKLQNGMLEGMIDALGDKYSTYYTAEEFNSFVEDYTGQYSGIGAYVYSEEDTGYIIIAKPFDKSPAAEAGLMAKDRILEISGVEVTGMDLNKAVSLMKGPENTNVDIKILRDNKEMDFTVTRKVVDVPTLSHSIIDNGNVGYIYITSFEGSTVDQFDEAISEFESKNVKGIIIDLRDNGGGNFQACIKMLDRILPEGLLTYTENKDGRAEEYYSTDGKKCDIPMVVMINENSASASEVFAGCVKDFEAATLVGTTSFGKGIVQGIYPLKKSADGSAVKLTISKYFSPKGTNIHKTGIEPDVTVEYDEKSLKKDGDFYYDNQINKAIEILTK